jgi:hypothetical protein
MLTIWYKDTKNWTSYKNHKEEISGLVEFNRRFSFLKSCSDVRDIIIVCPICGEKYDVRYQENEEIWDKKHDKIIGCRHEKMSKCSNCGTIFNPKRYNDKCPHGKRKIALTFIQLERFKFIKAM